MKKSKPSRPLPATPWRSLEFVKADGIDPIYYDSSYFMVPEEAGKKAYHLLLETMRKSGYSAIAKITMHQREYTVVVRPHADGLLLHTMFYPEEVREVPEFRRDENITVKPQEVALAEKLVEGLAADFDPSKYHDEYQIKMQQMIEAKKEGLPRPLKLPRNARRSSISCRLCKRAWANCLANPPSSQPRAEARERKQRHAHQEDRHRRRTCPRTAHG